MSVTLASSRSLAPAQKAASGNAATSREKAKSVQYRPSLWREIADWVEDWFFVDNSFVLLFRALIVAAGLSILALFLFTMKHEAPVARGERPNRVARARAPTTTALLRLSRPDPNAAALDSDFSLEQAALTWSHRIGDRDEDANPNVMRFGSVKVHRSIVERVVKAAEKTEMDPVLLMAIADKESNFSTTAHAKTSSASGLFQFIDKTWLQAVKQFGDRHGHGDAANAIAAVTEADVKVSPDKRAKILNLRNDPYLSAALAAEVLKKESAAIAEKIGRALTAGEVYLVHFLGPEDAARFIRAKEEAPQVTAAALFPKPARANRPIFYEGAGRPKTVGEVHEAFEAMMGKRTSRYEDVATKLPTGVSAYAE